MAFLLLFGCFQVGLLRTEKNKYDDSDNDDDDNNDHDGTGEKKHVILKAASKAR